MTAIATTSKEETLSKFNAILKKCGLYGSTAFHCRVLGMLLRHTDFEGSLLNDVKCKFEETLRDQTFGMMAFDVTKTHDEDDDPLHALILSSSPLLTEADYQIRVNFSHPFNGYPANLPLMVALIMTNVCVLENLVNQIYSMHQNGEVGVWVSEDEHTYLVEVLDGMRHAMYEFAQSDDDKREIFELTN